MNEGWVLLIGLFLLLGIAAGLYPQVDLAVSGWFYTKGQGFVVTPFLEFLHKYGPNALVVLALLAAGVLWRRKRLTGREALYVPACFLIGPGLLVNAVLKEHYGRARPLQVEQFGGTAHFTSALMPAHECAHNCSFSSGDPSVAFTLIVFALLLPAYRAPLTVLALALGAAFGLLRIAQGGHFLSDVLFTAVVTITTAVTLYPLTRGKGSNTAFR